MLYTILKGLPFRLWNPKNADSSFEKCHLTAQKSFKIVEKLICITKKLVIVVEQHVSILLVVLAKNRSIIFDKTLIFFGEAPLFQSEGIFNLTLKKGSFPEQCFINRVIERFLLTPLKGFVLPWWELKLGRDLLEPTNWILSWCTLKDEGFWDSFYFQV